MVVPRGVGVRVSSSSQRCQAEIAQLVEHNLAKVGVASSSLVFRSRRGSRSPSIESRFLPRWRNGRRARFRCACREACRFDSCSGHFGASQRKTKPTRRKLNTYVCRFFLFPYSTPILQKQASYLPLKGVGGSRTVRAPCSWSCRGRSAPPSGCSQ